MRIPHQFDAALESSRWSGAGPAMTSPEDRVIAIVDDDEPVRDSMRLLLESMGFSTRDYASAAEMLEDPHRDDCDCLILDLHMPGMSGLELLELLRARGSKVAALLITGRGDSSLNDRVARAGILATLSKPVSEDLLLEWVERACEDS
jgi:FixJ family two-component response regulator